MSLIFDVVVIGGGLLGCFVARSLTRYNLSVALLEMREDLCTGISRSNTAIVYSGCDTKPGTLKSSMCVSASQGFAALCEELGVRYSPCGSIMICFGERGHEVLLRKYKDGAENGVRGMRLLTREEVLELEPNIASTVHSGLFVPDTGTVMPWELCLAAAENAAHNGAEFFLNCEVLGVKQGYEIETTKGVFRAKAIVNCAGMAADRLLEMTYEPVVRIVPSAGEYLIFDTKTSGAIGHVIFHEPEKKGKGLTLVPTVDGNIMAGPTERPLKQWTVESKQVGGTFASHASHAGDCPRPPSGEQDGCLYGYETEQEGLDLLQSLVREIVPSLSHDHIIRSFGTVRPNPYLMYPDCNGGWVQSDKSVSDFCIVESGDGRFVSLVGVKTPGLTCANELGAHVAEKIASMLGSEPRVGGDGEGGFEPCRKPPVRLGELSFEDREACVREDPGCGAIVCRCRGVSESEIQGAIKRFPGASTRDGVKRRTGAGSGRCQGSFCGQAVEEIIASQLRMNNGDLRVVRPLTSYDVIVIGGGPAGMAAALGASECGAKVLVVERADSLGGILNQCTHKGFGLTYFGEELTGQEYAARFIERVKASAIEVQTGCIVLNVGADGILTLSGRETGLVKIHSRAIVLATGCRERPIGSLLIPGTRPEGVFAAGAAQKMINLGGYDLGERFVILGSGDVGMIVARELALRGKNVIAVIEKEAYCGGLERNRVNCLERFDIPLITSATVSRIQGSPRITGVTVKQWGEKRDKQGDEAFVSFDIECDALITSVGLVPERDLLDQFGGGLPDWLFLCGNSCFVHDVVDDVTLESERTGRFAAQFAEQGDGFFAPHTHVLSSHVPHPRALHPADSHNSEVLCTACPKGCNATKAADGWQGLLCGRSEPVSCTQE